MQNPLTAWDTATWRGAGYFDNVNGRLGFQDNTLDQDKVPARSPTWMPDGFLIPLSIL